MPAIDARGLCKTFGAVTAANEVSAAIERDSVVGLIGTNGAGKTTFINMITGYIKPDRGSIAYEGRDITALPPRYHAPGHLPLVPDSPALPLAQRVRQHDGGPGHRAAQRGRRRHATRDGPVPGYGKSAPEVAEHLLERFGLADYRDRDIVLPGGAQAPRHRAHHGGQAEDPPAG